jgi:hypothetical protein
VRRVRNSLGQLLYTNVGNGDTETASCAECAPTKSFLARVRMRGAGSIGRRHAIRRSDGATESAPAVATGKARVIVLVG